MDILKYIFGALCAALLTGCYETFDPRIVSKPVLCLNSVIIPGAPIDIEVTHTWFYTDTAAERNHSVTDAVIAVYANGSLCPNDYLPQEGDVIRITANSQKYGYAEAEVTVPYAPQIGISDFKYEVVRVYKYEEKPMDEGLNMRLRVALSLKDRPGEENYYFLNYDSHINYNDESINSCSRHFSRYDFPAYFNPGNLTYEFEPVLSEHIGVFESAMGAEVWGTLFFSDRQFEGKSYTLDLHFNNASYRVDSPEYDPEFYNTELFINLASTSQSLYRWNLYQWHRNEGTLGDLGDLGFAESMWGYSNVSTGAGIVAAYSMASVSINLREIIQSAMEHYRP